MDDPVISCPRCHSEVRLTESLAAPLIASVKREFENRLALQSADVARREQAMKEREAGLLKERESLDQLVGEKLNAERAKIAADEARKAQRALGADLETRGKEIVELQALLKSREQKLAEAQKAQAEILRRQRELDDARREMELTIEKRVSDSLRQVRDSARQEAEEHLLFKVMEKEHIIASMQKQIEELKNKAEQGSVQLQGEVQELFLESLLAERFPADRLQPVPKGEHGGDILQRVVTPAGVECGTILWESKRTRNWIDNWLPKLRDDQRAAKAEIAILVSGNLPRGVDMFDQVDGVWVTHPRALIPVAMSLRQMLMEVHGARQASEGQQTKMEMIYRYLTGPRFRMRIQAIVEAFNDMTDDLAKERRAIMKQWAKREEQIARVMEATVGMYGEMQGIAGKSLAEIEGLKVDLLEEDVFPQELPGISAVA